MSEIFESRTLDASEIDSRFQAKIRFLSKDAAWVARKISELQSTKFTEGLFCEEYKDAVLTPIGQNQGLSGGVFDQSRRQIQLARILHREDVIFGNARYDDAIKYEMEIDEGIWVGKMTAHFGHFITEGIARLHAAWANNLPIIYSGKLISNSQQSRARLLPWMSDVLRLIGIDPSRIIFIEKNTIVRRLYVPNPGLELSRSLNLDFVNALRMRVEKALSPISALEIDQGENLFLSRSNLVDARIALGELPLQVALGEKGWNVLHPEALPFHEQISKLVPASAVAGLYGSQMHTLLFRPASKSLDVVFLATSYFNTTYLHADLLTPGLKIVAQCDNYGNFPKFGNATPYCLSQSVVRRAFELIGVSLKSWKDANEDYPQTWFKALAEACNKKKIAPHRLDAILAAVPTEVRDQLQPSGAMSLPPTIHASDANSKYGILIVGHSHTEAISSAIVSDEESSVKVVNLNARDRNMSVSDKIKSGDYLPDPGGFKLQASMVGGNFYNTFGLIESSVPFDFAEPSDSSFSLELGRQLISYELMHSYFSDVMQKGFLRSIIALRDYYGDSFVHIISPPPIGDDRHIAENPGGYFSDKIHLGVAPASLRGKLYRLHTRVVVEFCRKNGIPTLPPPPEAVTEDGFLARPFWKKDPTHANAAYGRLVLEQLRGYQA